MFSKFQLFFISLILLSLFGYFTYSVNKKYASSDMLLSKKNLVKNHFFTRKRIPVLCYHAIRDSRKNDSPDQKAYSVSPNNFVSQIKALANHGYTSITPDDLKAFWTTNQSLPKNPIIITFDDGRKDQYDIGSKILDEYHFKGVFFIMTVAIGKHHYMSQNEIKDLSTKGHIIGCHTWDHHKVTHYKNKDWLLQLSKPKKQLEKITQKPVTCFAYPYGVWNHEAADSLKNYGFTTAFIFYGKQDPALPLYTIERIAVRNSGTVEDFLTTIKKNEDNN
jgi:peptidoglycan/xylan/chitin deacetylase (PgdA/CDA1 family)